MNIKQAYKDYRVYAFILGMVAGTIIYNIFKEQFYFLSVQEIKQNNFINGYLYLLMINLKFLVIVFVLSFFRHQKTIEFIIIFIQSFLMAGMITLAVTLKNILFFSSIPETGMKIGSTLFVFREGNKKMGMIISILILVLGTAAENIFFIKF